MDFGSVAEEFFQLWTRARHLGWKMEPAKARQAKAGSTFVVTAPQDHLVGGDECTLFTTVSVSNKFKIMVPWYFWQDERIQVHPPKKRHNYRVDEL